MIRNNYSYFNGHLVPFEDLNLHVTDLLFQRGYGVFDYFRSREGKIPWLNDYLDRLFSSLDISGIEVDMDRERFVSVLHKLQQRNGLEDGAFKVIVTGGYSDNLETVSGKANVMVLNVPWNKPPIETFEKGVHLIRENFVRPNPEVKTLYYYNTLRLQKKLREYGAVDVLYHSDKISETSRTNLFFIKGNDVYTPASNILKGITRKQILTLFSEIRVEDIEAGQLYDFDEIFLTSTSRDVTPVVSVEGQKIGTGTPGPITREIQAAFKAKIL